MLAGSWNETPQKIIINCWKHAGIIETDQEPLQYQDEKEFSEAREQWNTLK